MTLTSPTHAVLGAADLDEAVAFLGGFGFAVAHEGVASADLWGPGAGGREVELRTPGARAGHLLVVETAAPAPAAHPYARGAHALDVYARSVTEAVAGRDHGPVGHVVLGPLTMEQVIVAGPVPLVLIETERRRSSVLDDDPAAAFSQAHSLVWSVDDIEAAAAWWRDVAGLTVPMVFGFADAQVCRFMGLPREDVPIRMCMVSDPDVSPLRLELLQFTDEAGPDHGSTEVRPGLHGPLFTVVSLADVDLPGATLGPVVAVTGSALGQGRARWGRSPQGVGFTAWEPAG